MAKFNADTVTKIVEWALQVVGTATASLPMQQRAKEIIEAKQAEGREDFTQEEWDEIAAWANVRRDDFYTDDEA